MQGEFVDTVIGIPGSRSEIVMLRPPGGGPRRGPVVLLPARPPIRVCGGAAHRTGTAQRGLGGERPPGSPWPAGADGYGLVGGIGRYEHIWRMAYGRGPDGIIVSLAERIG